MEAPADIVAEIRRDIKEMKDSGGNNASNVIQFHGSAPGWTMAGVVVAALCLGMLCVAAVMLWGMNERISDLKDQINADQIELEGYKVSNEERARTDRLLSGSLKERITKLEATQ